MIGVRTQRKRMQQVLLYALMSVVCGVVALPFLWLFASSFKTTREIFVAPFGLPEAWQWANYLRAWQGGIANYIGNSLLVTAVSVLIIITVSGMAAYALARLQFQGRVAIYLLIVVGYAVPIHTVIVPLYELLSDLNLLNTYPGLIGPYVAFGMPFSVLLLYGFFLEFPKELEDAAYLDGCNMWQLLWHVVAPVSRPALASVAIFQGVFIWNEFLLALIIMNDKARQTLPVGLATFRGEWASNWPVLLAAVSLATLPILLIYVLLQRYFVNSLTGFGK